MAWYYVDAAGQTQGSFEVSVMKTKFASKELTEESYVWNGTSVNQWTPLKNVAELLNQVKQAAAPAKPSRPARRKNPLMGGGGRANFLASIQKGANLKKVEPKKEADKPAPKGGGGGGGGFGGGMDLMSQLRAKQNAMKKGGKIGGAAGGGGAKPKPSGGKKTWGKPSGGATSTAPKTGATKKTWGKPSGGATTSKPSYGGGGGGNKSTRITRIKNKLDSADEWQLKAIEKLLS